MNGSRPTQFPFSSYHRLRSSSTEGKIVKPLQIYSFHVLFGQGTSLYRHFLPRHCQIPASFPASHSILLLRRHLDRLQLYFRTSYWQAPFSSSFFLLDCHQCSILASTLPLASSFTKPLLSVYKLDPKHRITPPLGSQLAPESLSDRPCH